MIEHLPTITQLNISDITIGERLRPVDECHLSVLMQLIREHGFTSPILVRRVRDGFELVDGAHRLTAMSRLKHESISVYAVRCTNAEARSLEAGQNLVGGMSPLDDALFLAAYAQAYEERYPETKQGTAGALAKHDLATELSSFADVIAGTRGITPRQARKIAAAGRRISREEADKLRAAPRQVTLKDVDRIGRIADAGTRGSVIKMLSEGTAKSAEKALKAQTSEPGAAVEDPVKQAVKRLSDAWSRAPKEARRRFVAQESAGLFNLLQDLDGGLSE